MKVFFYCLTIYLSFFYVYTEPIISDNITKVVCKEWLKRRTEINDNLCALILTPNTKEINNISSFSAKIVCGGTEKQTYDIKINYDDITKVNINGSVKDFSQYPCGIFYLELINDENNIEKIFLYLNDLNSLPAGDISTSFLDRIELKTFKVIKFKNATSLENSWKNASSLFYRNDSLKSVDFGDFNYNFENLSYMFAGCFRLKKIDVSNIITNNIETLEYIFGGCSKLNEINLLKNNVDTNKLINISFMFYECLNLTKIHGIEYLNTSKVKNMGSLFRKCHNLKSLNLSSFNTSNVENMELMFYNTERIEQIYGIENFDTSKVENMNMMFSYCNRLKHLDISNFKLNAIKNKNYYGIIHKCNIDNLIYDKKFIRTDEFCLDSKVKNITLKDNKVEKVVIKNIDDKDESCYKILQNPESYSRNRESFRNPTKQKVTKVENKCCKSCKDNCCKS